MKILAKELGKNMEWSVLMRYMKVSDKEVLESQIWITGTN